MTRRPLEVLDAGDASLPTFERCLEAELTRRGFLGAAAAPLVVAALAACGGGGDGGVGPGPGPGGGTPDGVTVSGNVVTVDLDRQPGLRAANGFLLVGSAKVVVVNVGGTTFRAFTSVCTHQQCDVSQFTNGHLVCPCHGSRFDTSGAVVEAAAGSGLTPQTQAPLRMYAVAHDASSGRVTITKS